MQISRQMASIQEFFLQDLRRTHERDREEGAAKLLLGAFYSKCGFTHVWSRHPAKTEKDYPTRYDCLCSSLSELQEYGISHDDLRYLLGSGTPYWPYEDHYVQQTPMTVPEAARLLESRFQRITNKDRIRLFLAVWKFLTGYDTYSEGYNNVLENRTITENKIGIIDLEGDGDVEAFFEEMERTGGGWY
jgi:hypothetical protein